MKLKLFGFELAWATAAFDAVLPQHPALPHGVAGMNPARFFGELIAAAPLEQSLGLRVALWLVALAPIWTLYRPKTIASLGHDDRQRVLARLVANPIYAIRQLALAFKALATMLYARSREARAAMTTPSSAPRLVQLRRGGTIPPLVAPEVAHAHAAAE